MMLETTARFCSAIKKGKRPRWLSLLGRSGTGKTHLARQVWSWFADGPQFEATVINSNSARSEILHAGSKVWWPRLADDIRSNRGWGELRDLQSEKLVFLDEIGADRDPSGVVRDALSRLLCGRVGKWTIITSNLDLEGVERHIDPRVSSRMIREENEVAVVDLPDYWAWKKGEVAK